VITCVDHRDLFDATAARGRAHTARVI